MIDQTIKFKFHLFIVRKYQKAFFSLQHMHNFSWLIKIVVIKYYVYAAMENGSFGIF